MRITQGPHGQTRVTLTKAEQQLLLRAQLIEEHVCNAMGGGEYGWPFLRQQAEKARQANKVAADQKEAAKVAEEDARPIIREFCQEEAMLSPTAATMALAAS